MRSMLKITPVPILADNYTWLISPPQGRNAVVVDPGDSAPVVRALESLGLTLSAIIVTHHHGDHVAGVAELVDNGTPVYGPRDSNIPNLTNPVSAGETMAPAGLETRFDVIAVPGHTLDHLAYFGGGALFAGDALFAGGCGRMFEGKPEQMQAYLAQLRTLPGETRLYCGHEYTLANLEFAVAVEPDNQALQQRLENVRQQRAKGVITLPSTLAEECDTNPFLRWDSDAVKRQAEARAGQQLDTPAEVFAVLRQWKDNF